MERLTKREGNFIKIGKNTKISLDCKLPIMQCVIKLAEYEDLEEQGRLFTKWSRKDEEALEGKTNEQN